MGVIYRLQVNAIKADGSTVLLETSDHGRWLQGFTLKCFRSTKHFRVVSRGKRFLLTQAQQFPAFLCSKLGENNYRRVDVTLEYRDVTDKEMTQQRVADLSRQRNEQADVGLASGNLIEAFCASGRMSLPHWMIFMKRLPAIWQAWAAIGTECFLAFGLWSRLLKCVALAVGIDFHLFVDLTLSIGTFS